VGEGFEAVISSGKPLHQSKRPPLRHPLVQPANQGFSQVNY
jgi:hypothetical protein